MTISITMPANMMLGGEGSRLRLKATKILMNKTLRKILIIVCWIALWALIALAVGTPVVLANPLEVVVAWGQALATPAFWMSIAVTFAHIVVGALIGCVAGCVLAAGGFRWPLFAEIFQPAVQFIKSAPLVCFVVLLLVWVGSSSVDTVAVAFALLPTFYFSTLQGLHQIDVGRVQLCDVMGIAGMRRVRLLVLPAVRPFFLQAAKTASGLAWKSGVTAELIGLTGSSIGAAVYASKLTLDTASLLMWMIVTVLLGWLSEKALVKLIGAASARNASRAARSCAPSHHGCKSVLPLEAQGIAKSFETPLFADVSLSLQNGSRLCIMAPTGSGKTTLVEILLGLEKPDAGQVRAAGAPLADVLHAGVVFQDSRFFPELTAWQNAALATRRSEGEVRAMLGRLIQADYMDVYPDQLSGGMKRCVDICRALLMDSEVVVLDEPFAGLDEHTKELAIRLIQDEIQGRALVLTTHVKQDALALECQVVRLGNAVDAELG